MGERNRGRDREKWSRSRSSIHWSLPRGLQQPGLGQAKSRSQELHLGLSCSMTASPAAAQGALVGKRIGNGEAGPGPGTLL